MKELKELKELVKSKDYGQISKERLSEIVKILLLHALDKSIRKGFGKKAHLKRSDYEDKLASTIIKNVSIELFL